MEGWEDKQICIKGVSDGQNEGEGRVTLQYRKLIHIHIQVSCLVTQNQIQKVYSTSSEQTAKG